MQRRQPSTTEAGTTYTQVYVATRLERVSCCGADTLQWEVREGSSDPGQAVMRGTTDPTAALAPHEVLFTVYAGDRVYARSLAGVVKARVGPVAVETYTRSDHG